MITAWRETHAESALLQWHATRFFHDSESTRMAFLAQEAVRRVVEDWLTPLLSASYFGETVQAPLTAIASVPLQKAWGSQRILSFMKAGQIQRCERKLAEVD